MESNTGGRLRAAFDPRQRIERDPFNELFVLVLSGVGAAIIAPVAMLIVGAFAGDLGVLLFVGACVAIELVLIFGIGRPQMKPNERVGWALLWGAAAALLAVCFYYLVFDPVI